MSTEVENLKKLKGATGKNRSKSKSKQAGVKSTMVVSKGVAISSYAEIKNAQGKKISNIEILTSSDGVQTHLKNLKFFKNAEIDAETVKLEGGIGNVEFDNPAKNISKGDYIGIKSTLEKKYFGTSFPNDNVHVQIAYNIADIKKYITQFINQIVYAFFNINRMLKPNEYVDFIGMLYWNGTLKNNTNIDSQRILDGVMYYDAYFPKIFKIPKKDASEKDKENARNHNWDIFRGLSAIRQACEHETLAAIGNTDKVLYDLENVHVDHQGVLNILNKLYQSVIDNVNRDFSILANKKNVSQQTSYDKMIQNKKKEQIKQEKDKQINNLYILSQIYNRLSYEELFEKYYCYAVKKEQNNIGINLKLLREIIIEKYMREVRDSSYDSFRSKLYIVLGFILTEHFKNNQAVQETVVKLRVNNSEEGRLLIYEELADKVWNSIKQTLISGKNAVKKESLNHFKGKLQFSIDVNSQPYAIKNKEISYFTKLINLMTKFLNGKEINELLTGLISRFDNIADLTDSANECSEKITYKKEYSIFYDARKIAQELKLLKNVAKMKPEIDSVKNSVLFDAAEILGWNDKLFNQVDVTDEEKNTENNAFLNRIYDKESEKPNKRLRNFIINNVVDSKWFFYIARYTKPAVCRKLMTNKKLIAFVLNEIPDEQINRYYKSVEGVTCDNVSEAREKLVYLLHNFTIDKIFDDVESLDKKEYASQKEGTVKQKNQAIVGLYLTVAYLFVKNMVKINAVFSIAFSCLERDSSLLLKGTERDNPFSITEEMIKKDAVLVQRYNSIRDNIRDNCSLSTEEKRKEYKKELKPILSQMHYSLHSYYYVKANLENAKSINAANNKIYVNYRNTVAHLNVITEMVNYISGIKDFSSYYSIYAYCLEKSILKRSLGNMSNVATDFIMEQRDKINQTGAYSKELLWALNVPFAYNMARYKNLTIEDLFYGRYVKTPLYMPKNATPAQTTAGLCPDKSLIGKSVEIKAKTVSKTKALRGETIGKRYAVTVSKKALENAGIFKPTSEIGKKFKVKIEGWDQQSGIYIASIVK